LRAKKALVDIVDSINGHKMHVCKWFTLRILWHLRPANQSFRQISPRFRQSTSHQRWI